MKFFNWIGTMWGGQARLQACRWCGAIGFLLTFLLGGLTGPMLASPPLDFHLSDSYFVVAHFHYVLFGGSVFGIFAAVYYWFPKFTGRMLDERLGMVHFVLTFVGFHAHVPGAAHRSGSRACRAASRATPRRTGSARSTSCRRSARSSSASRRCRSSGTCGGRTEARADRRATTRGTPRRSSGGRTSPPVPENFDVPLPPIRSERPVWDANHPDALARH